MNDFWKKKKVLVTGGYGFIGQHLTKKLLNRGVNPPNLILFHKSDYDLRKESAVEDLFKKFESIDLVIHLAGSVGGIGYNRANPGKVFYDNIMMNTLVMDYARKHNVEKFVGIGSVCSYPKFAPIPFQEKDLWNGYPEETNASYGLAKKMMLVQGQAYREQYGFNAVHLLLVNVYGPGDNFDLDSSHVIAGLIRKFVDAVWDDKKEVVVWGTGTPSREFIYVEDAAEGILKAAEKYDKPDPINLGAGFEISIKGLVSLIAELTGFKDKIIWDTTKPDGQPRRMLDTSKAEREFGFKAKTNFEEGLKKTIEWYISKKSIKSTG